MNPLLILFIAMAIVIGTVVFFRLHAFLALLAGAVAVALLTPKSAVFESELLTVAAKVRKVDGQQVHLKRARKQELPVFPGRATGPVYLFRRQSESRSLEKIGVFDLLNVKTDPETKLDVCDITDVDSVDDSSTSAASEIQVGDNVVTEDQLSYATSISKSGLGTRIATGFGQTCVNIGILIALAAIVGGCLLESGAAESVVLAVRKLCGEKQSPLAFALSGFVVGIPVFFDTVFYLLLPLAKAMRRKTGRNYLLYVMSIVIGATMAHSLVPPTPGPLFVATELDVSLGKMILGGSVVGLLAMATGFIYILFANRWWEIPLRDDDATAVEPLSESELPPLFLSILPILTPVLLLSANTIFGKTLAASTSTIGRYASSVLHTLGDANIALGIAAILALLMLFKSAKYRTNIDSKQVIQAALSSAGNVILITAIGGAFGHVLRQTDIAHTIQDLFPAATSGTFLLCVAFGVTAIVRVAQGSATVAMITAIGIVGPLANSIELSFDPLYLALAIGCGSKPLPWMNDSGFWVVGRMSGMTERETLKTQTVTLTIMGITGFLFTLAGATWFPLKT